MRVPDQTHEYLSHEAAILAAAALTPEERNAQALVSVVLAHSTTDEEAQQMVRHPAIQAKARRFIAAIVESEKGRAWYA